MASVISIAWDSTSARLRVLTDGYGAGQIANLAIVSGKLADNSIHLAAIAAGLFTADATGRGKFAAGFLVSSLVAPGSIGGGLMANQGILSGKLADESIHLAAIRDGLFAAAAGARAKFANGFLVSSLVAAGAIGGGLVANQGILSGKYASQSIRTADLGLGQVVSSIIGAEAIGGGLVANQGILSGKLADESIHLAAIKDNLITEAKLVSGISIDIAEQLSEGSYSAKEAISSYALVYLDNDRKVKLATALSGAMPAIGINAATLVASGGLPLLSYAGRAGAPSSVISGQYKKPVYVGANSQITLTPPGSGYIIQPVGIVGADNAIFFIPNPILVEVA